MENRTVRIFLLVLSIVMVAGIFIAILNSANEGNAKVTGFGILLLIGALGVLVSVNTILKITYGRKQKADE